MTEPSWKAEWPRVLKRLRDVSPSYARSVRQRRVAVRTSTKPSDKTPRPAAAERLLKQLLRVLHPESLEDPPSEAAQQRLRAEMFPPSTRRTLAQHPDLPVHKDILACVAAKRVRTAEQAALVKRLARGPGGLRGFRSHNVLSSLRTLAKLGTTEALTLQQGAIFCALGGAVRQEVLLAKGFRFSREVLVAKVEQYRKERQRFRTTFQRKPGLFQRYLDVLEQPDLHAALRRSPQRRPLLVLLQQRFPNAQLRDLQTVSATDRLRALSPFHAQLFDDMLACEAQNRRRTAFPKVQLEQISRAFARFMLQLQDFVSADCVMGEGADLRHWLQHCTLQQLQQAITACARRAVAHHDSVRSQRVRHQGLTIASFALRFLRGPLRPHLGCKELPLLKDILSPIPNQQRPPPEARRTFTDEEIDRLLAAARDPAEGLLLTLLREIALRNAALTHLQYKMLLTPEHVVRDVCQVPEKGNKLRCFVPSPNLRARILDLADLLRQQYPQRDLASAFLLNLSNLEAPCKSIRDTLKRLASAAGITGVRIHPHAFRHTLVQKLVEVGNPLAAVSKWLGHENLQTTARFYYVPTALELERQLINPFSPNFQQQRAKQMTHDMRLEVAEAKIALARRILDAYQKHCVDRPLPFPNLAAALQALDTAIA
jgi:integrase